MPKRKTFLQWLLDQRPTNEFARWCFSECFEWDGGKVNLRKLAVAAGKQDEFYEADKAFDIYRTGLIQIRTKEKQENFDIEKECWWPKKFSDDGKIKKSVVFKIKKPT